MKTSVVPTIGRIVRAHVQTDKGPQVLPDMILRVFAAGDDEYNINAKVFGDSANTGWEFRELYTVPISDPVAPNMHVPFLEWCEWMPYQKGQAARPRSKHSRACLERPSIRTRRRSTIPACASNSRAAASASPAQCSSTA